MKKQYITLVMAGLIGIFSAVRAENNDPAQVQTAQAQVVPTEVTPAEVQPVVHKEAPILVPFDQALYKKYCEACQNKYKAIVWEKGQMIASVATFAGIGLYHLKTVGLPGVIANLSSVWQTFWQASLLSKAWTLWNSSAYLRLGTLVVLACYATQTIGKDFISQDFWEEREKLLLLDALKAQKLWHQEVFARLGKPEVIGKASLTRPYTLILHKKNGLIVHLNPHDHAQVELLLGTRDQENLRCVKVEIVVEENKTDLKS